MQRSVNGLKRASERRSCVRGNFTYQVQYRVVVAAGSEVRQNDLPDDEMDRSDKKVLKPFPHFPDSIDTGRLPDTDLIGFLMQMDEKLDRILALLTDSEAQRLPVSSGLGCNISASGMSMIVDRPLQPKQMIAARIVLSRFPFVHIRITGEIIRVAPVKSDGREQYRVGLRFVDLDTCDREKIVACVFRNQRECIRKQKENEKDNTKRPA